VIEEDQPKGQPAEQIKPQIAFGHGRRHAAFLSPGYSI
jgi:hypothetical protein